MLILLLAARVDALIAPHTRPSRPPSTLDSRLGEEHKDWRDGLARRGHARGKNRVCTVGRNAAGGHRQPFPAFSDSNPPASSSARSGLHPRQRRYRHPEILRNTTRPGWIAPLCSGRMARPKRHLVRPSLLLPVYALRGGLLARRSCNVRRIARPGRGRPGTADSNGDISCRARARRFPPPRDSPCTARAFSDPARRPETGGKTARMAQTTLHRSSPSRAV